MLNIKIVVLLSIFYLGVYLKDISSINIAIYYSFLLITGDKNGVYKYYKFIVTGFIGYSYIN